MVSSEYDDDVLDILLVYKNINKSFEKRNIFMISHAEKTLQYLEMWLFQHHKLVSSFD